MQHQVPFLSFHVSFLRFLEEELQVSLSSVSCLFLLQVLDLLDQIGFVPKLSQDTTCFEEVAMSQQKKSYTCHVLFVDKTCYPDTYHDSRSLLFFQSAVNGQSTVQKVVNSQEYCSNEELSRILEESS